MLKYPKLASASEKLCCFAWVFDLDQNTDTFVRYWALATCEKYDGGYGGYVAKLTGTIWTTRMRFFSPLEHSLPWPSKE